jgi:hypothetical protein
MAHGKRAETRTSRNQGLGRLCHIAVLPRDTRSRAIPGVSLQNAAAAVLLLSAGPPSPRRVRPSPRFSTFVRIRVSTGSHRDLVSRGIGGM